MYSNVLVPVDLSHEDTAARILKLAKGLSAPDATVTVLHVMPDIPTYVETYVPADVRESRATEQQQLLETVAKDADLPKAVVRLAHGIPHARILDIADEISPDLVIIGSHKPGLSDYFLGSTAARVVRHARCAVLVDR